MAGALLLILALIITLIRSVGKVKDKVKDTNVIELTGDLLADVIEHLALFCQALLPRVGLGVLQSNHC